MAKLKTVRRRRRRAEIVSVVTCVLGVAVAACSGDQSVLAPEGNIARGIAGLFWLLASVSVLIWAAVMAVLIFTIRRVPSDHTVAVTPDAARERRMGRTVGLATGATVVTLLILTLSSYLTTRSFGSEPANAVRIRLTGKQWWWQVQYEGSSPSKTFEMANEIHVPVGQPVSITLLSNEVIHSFWVPNISGNSI